MKSFAKCYQNLREHIEAIPLIDCHDHTFDPRPEYTCPLQVVANEYFVHDLMSVSSEEEVMQILDTLIPLEKRWPSFEKMWNRTCHTGYAQVTKRVLKKFYNEDELSLDALKRMQGKMTDLKDLAVVDDILEQAKILVRLEDVLISDLAEHITRTKSVLDGSYKLTPRGRLVISLPDYHHITTYDNIQELASIVNKTVTNLDEYLHVCVEIFQGCKDFGAVAFKDQSAYKRKIKYSNPTKHQAEEIFNWIMDDPRRQASYPDGIKELDDYLFNEFMVIAKNLDLPVQIHTGHMAGVRNDITKTNAVHLTSIIERHREVRFDLFHANWPYSGEVLFLAKNHPNVTIDFCWANIIDPIYCQNMFKQILSAVPHGKVHGYGSDFGGCQDRAWAHASIARDNVAIALADMVESEYINIDEAKEIAEMWLFKNANEFFRLGF